MLMAKVVVNVWLREAYIDHTLCSYWLSSRPSGQAGQSLLIFLIRATTAKKRQFYYVNTLTSTLLDGDSISRSYGLSANTVHNRLRKK